MYADITLSREFAAPYDVRRVRHSLGDDVLHHARSGPVALTRGRVSDLDAINNPVRRSGIYDRLDLALIRRGQINIVARDLHIVVSAGEMILLDHQEQFSFHADDDTDCLCVTMPKYWLMRQNPLCSRSMFQVMAADQPFVQTMHSFLQEWEASGNGPAHLYGVQFGSLLSLITATSQPDAAKPQSRLANAIMVAIREQCTDPLLNAESVAASLGISRRYLYVILARAGTTFNRELVTARLETSHMILTNPEYNGIQIGEVASLSGFHDQGHFTRRFRARYGIGPRDIRKADV